MKSPHYFVVRPYNGRRYDNIRKYGDNEFIISSSQEDHTVTNRVGVVDSVPLGYDGSIKPGDHIVVHHNVFRLYYDMKGRERSSWNHYKEDIFIVEMDQVFLYRDPNGEWQSPYPFCFVSPIDKDNEFGVSYDNSAYKILFGKIEYIPSNIVLNKGDIVSFQPESEYEFRIDDKLMYRIKIRNLCLRI
jgi:hypothetical protein